MPVTHDQVIDALRPAQERSHLGDLALRMTGGHGELWEIVRRKLLMNLRLVTAVPFVASMAAVAPVLLLWYHGSGQRSIDADDAAVDKNTIGAIDVDDAVSGDARA